VKPPHEELRITGAGDIEGGCFINGTNHFLMPSRRRGIILRVDLDTLDVANVSIPIQRTVRCIKHSPNKAALFLIDTARTVCCFDSALEHGLWTTAFKSVPPRSGIYVGAYCGNGALIGLTLTRYDGFDTIVLEADTGREIDRIAGTSCEGYPFNGDRVLLESGTLLDLRSKELTESVSNITA
jgi:hypothetical protein